MLELKPCPFCGSDKVLLDSKTARVGWNGLGHSVERHTYSVRCNKCHARGPTAGGRVIPNFFRNAHPITGEPLDDRGVFCLPVWAKTDRELHDKAVEGWNRRASDG